MMHETLFDRLRGCALYEKDTGGQTSREYALGNGGDSGLELQPNRTPRPTKTPKPPRQNGGGRQPEATREPEATQEPAADRVQTEDSSFSSHSAWDNQESFPVLTEEPIWGQAEEMTTQSAWEEPVAAEPALTEKSGVIIMVLLAVVAVLLAVQIVLTGALLRRFPGRKKEKLMRTRNL